MEPNLNINATLFCCCTIVFDAGPTMKQHWASVFCLSGSFSALFRGSTVFVVLKVMVL